MKITYKNMVLLKKGYPTLFWIAFPKARKPVVLLRSMTGMLYGNEK